MASTLGIDGLASGLKTSELIAKMMEVEKRPLTLMQNKKTELQSKTDAWRDINSKLLTMRNSASVLKSTLTFKGRKATSSDSETISASSITGAVAGSFKVEVLSLAQAHTITSNGQTSASSALNKSGLIKINGKDVSINETDSLNVIAEKINNTTDIGVTAAVVQVGKDSYKLTLTSQKAGAANVINLEDDPEKNILAGLGLTDPKNVVQSAQNAEFKVNGVFIERESNEISDVIQGVTLNLNKANPGKTVTINVDTDFDQIVSAVKSFVEQYNAVTNQMEDYSKYDPQTKEKGVLFGDSTLNSMYSQLRRFISQTVSSANPAISQLNLVGITTGKVGSGIDAAKAGDLELDETKLREMLKSNFDDVAKLFGANITNVASMKNGAKVTASSELAGYPASSIIDGQTEVTRWESGAGWSNAIADENPKWVEIEFSSLKTIDSMNVYTVNTPQNPSDKYGVKDFNVEYWDITSNSWKSLTSVSDNSRPMVGLDFSAVTTNKIRINVTGVNGDDTQNDYARLTEVEVFEKRDGIFSQMYDSLFEMTSTDGMAKNKLKSFDKQMEDLDKRIKTMQTRLDDKETYYYKKFTAMEQALSKLQTQSAWLTSQLSALTTTKE